MPSRTRLHDRFPALRAALPRLPLGEGPTPVRELRGLSAQSGVPLWVKDDSGYGALWGGNKPRKLEWTLADAQRRGLRTVLTFGALATNHGLATALYARANGLRCVLVLVDQPWDDHVERQLERITASGARIYRVSHPRLAIAALPWILLRSSDHGRLPYLLPAGGSSPVGTIGFVEAGLELAEQVARGELPEPSHVLMALGTGGTAAGLHLGLRLGGLRTRVWPVLVNDRLRLSEQSLARLARRSAGVLRGRGADLGDLTTSPADFTLLRGWLGPGYGHPTPEAQAALTLTEEVEGLALEPVYTAKTVAALLHLARRGALGEGPVLYWHTHHGRAPQSGADRNLGG